MSPSYNQIAKAQLRQYLANAGKYESKEIIQLANKWGVVADNLTDIIDKLSQKKILSADQLYRLDTYQQFLASAKEQIYTYNNFASGVITNGQKQFAQIGLNIATDNIELITTNFHKLNLDSVKNMIGMTSDGSPLYDLLIKSYPQTIDKITNTLINANALGYNPVKTAGLLADSMNGNLTRALCVARTEQMRCLRESSLQQMEQSGVVKGWIRIEESDACDDCLAENGKHYSFDDSFDSHPNCRGACIADI